MLDENEKWFEVSLRVSGDPLDFSRVTSLIGFEPTRICRKGEHRNGNVRYAKYKEDAWIWRVTEDSSEPFESQLRKAVAKLQNIGAEINSLASKSGGEAYFFLGFSSGNGQGAADLPADFLLKVGELGIDISLDLYPPDVSEGDD